MYTKEQLAAIEEMKQEGLQDGAARAEFANHTLAADGTVSSDTDTMLSAVRNSVASILSSGTDPENMEKATAASRKVREVEQHLEQERFLFVLDAEGIPQIYFQCATPGNPDVR